MSSAASSTPTRLASDVIASCQWSPPIALVEEKKSDGAEHMLHMTLSSTATTTAGDMTSVQVWMACT